jgi:hypothetical protein
VLVLAMGPWTGNSLAAWFGLASGVVTGQRAHSILIREPETTKIDATALFLSYRENYTGKSLDPEVSLKILTLN